MTALFCKVNMLKSLNGPSHEILVLITYAQKSHLKSISTYLGKLEVHILVRAVKALGTLLLFEGSPEHLLLHNAISWLIEYSY